MSQEMCLAHGTPYEVYRQMSGGILARHCRWDGSLHPDDFMELLERPGVQLTPTDKNYKVYIEFEDDSDAEEWRVASVTSHDPEEEGWMRGTEIPPDVDTSGWGDLSESWVKLIQRGSKKTEKFYFEHLSEEQRKRFINMLNNKQISLAYPGHFYNLPFFISR